MTTEYWDEDLETAPWAEVERWQAERLRPFLEDLPGRSSFYADRLTGAPRPSLADGLTFLQELPLITKDDLRRSQDEQLPGRPFGCHQGVELDRIVQAVSSSGTTGHPTYYALTATDLAAWSDGIATVFYTAGIRPHDVIAHLVGLPMVAGGLPYADAFRRIGATLAWLGGFPTERILRSLPRLQVSAVLSTTSFGTYLADHCQQLIGTDANALGVRTLLGGGEPGLGQPEIREKVRRGWGLDHVREIMGLGDVQSGLWGECADEGGMHFCGQRSVAIELIDPASGARVPWAEGATGEVVYTTFAREATPVVRFRSADHVVVTATSCPCGRTSPRIRCVGRTDDMLIYKGMNVFPTAIRDVVVAEFRGVVEPYVRIWKDRADQVRFDRPIPLDVEAGSDLRPERYPDVAGDIASRLRSRLQVQAEVSVIAPGTLPRSAYKTPLLYVRGPQAGSP